MMAAKLKTDISLQDAKRLYPKCRYAVCNIITGNPVYLCPDFDSAQKSAESAYEYSWIPCTIVDLLFYDEKVKMNEYVR